MTKTLIHWLTTQDGKFAALWIGLMLGNDRSIGFRSAGGRLHQMGCCGWPTRTIVAYHGYWSHRFLLPRYYE